MLLALLLTPLAALFVLRSLSGELLCLLTTSAGPDKLTPLSSAALEDEMVCEDSSGGRAMGDKSGEKRMMGSSRVEPRLKSAW